EAPSNLSFKTLNSNDAPASRSMKDAIEPAAVRGRRGRSSIALSGDSETAVAIVAAGVLGTIGGNSIEPPFSKKFFFAMVNLLHAWSPELAGPRAWQHPLPKWPAS